MNKEVLEDFNIKSYQRGLTSVSRMLNSIVCLLKNFPLEKGLEDIVTTRLAPSKKAELKFIRKQIKKATLVYADDKKEVSAAMKEFNSLYPKAIAEVTTSLDRKYIKEVCELYEMALCKIVELS